MESFLKDLELKDKDRSIKALSRWRSAVSLVKNPRRRFRNVADLAKRALAQEKQKKIQGKFRAVINVQRAALHFTDAIGTHEFKASEKTRAAGFGIEPNDIASVVRSHDFLVNFPL